MGLPLPMAVLTAPDRAEMLYRLRSFAMLPCEAELTDACVDAAAKVLCPLVNADAAD